MKKSVARLFKGIGTQKTAAPPPAPDVSKPKSEGLHVLLDSPYGERALDIVLLHGLNAHWLDCYTDRETGVCWLRDLLPRDIPGTPYRLLSYGYDTSVDETKPMEHVVHDFLRRLSDLREDTETEMLPILFIAHSLGGILLKSALAISYDTHDAISNALATALLFGVPSNYVRDYERVATEDVDDAAQTPLMRALRQDLIFLGSTNVKFDEVGLPVKYRCQYFLESAGEVDVRELEEGELARLPSQDKVKLSKGHGPMIRYSRRDEPDYQRVVACVKAAVERLLADPTTVL